MGERLSLRDKALLRLADAQAPESPLTPFDSTQAGLALRLGASRSHVSRTMEMLLTVGWAYQERLRVAGFPRTLKAYWLTDLGWHEMAKVRNGLLARSVRAIKAGRPLPSMPLRNALALATPPLAVLEALERLEQGEALDLDAGFEPMLAGYVGGLPSVQAGPFVDVRPSQLSAIADWIDDGGPGALAVQGGAGMGKSRLVAEVLYRRKLRRHVFWCDVGDLEGEDELVQEMAIFLAKVGRQGALRPVSGKAGHTMSLGAAIRGLPLLVVFDSLDRAPPDVRSWVMQLVDLAATERSLKIILIGNLATSSSAEAILLEQLDAIQSSLFVAGLGLPEDHANAHSAAGGNPLILAAWAKASSGPANENNGALASSLRGIVGERDWQLLCWLALCRSAVPAEILAGCMDHYDACLASLSRLGVLNLVADGRHELWSGLRKAVHDQIPAARRKQMHARLAALYLALSDQAAATEDLLNHLLRSGQSGLAEEWILRNPHLVVDGTYRLFLSDARGIRS